MNGAILEDLASSMAFSSFSLGMLTKPTPARIPGCLLRLVLPNFTSFSPSAVTASSPPSSQPLGTEGDLGCEATAQGHQRLEGEHLPGVELCGSCRHWGCWRNEAFPWDEVRCDGKKEERRENIHQIQIFQLRGSIIVHLSQHRDPPTSPKAPQR